MRLIAKFVRLLSSILLLALSILVSPITFSNDGTKDEVNISLLSTGSQQEISNHLDVLRKQFHRRPVIEIAQDIWEINKVKYPDFKWELFEKDQIRAKAAEILVQAVRNNLSNYDLQEIRRFALEMLTTTNISDKLSAITLIGLIENPEDVPKLVAVAADGKDPVFNEVVGILSTMCIKDAEPALTDLLNSDADFARKEGLSARVAAIKKFKVENSLCAKKSGSLIPTP
jgi:hypothetical protein